MLQVRGLVNSSRAGIWVSQTGGHGGSVEERREKWSWIWGATVVPNLKGGPANRPKLDDECADLFSWVNWEAGVFSATKGRIAGTKIVKVLVVVIGLSASLFHMWDCFV